MTWWHRLIARARLERELDAELTDHRDRQIADYKRDGMSDAEARRQAVVDFGTREAVKEACRDARGTRWLEDLATDVRYACRRLRKHPAFAGVAVLSLALGIGGTAAMFSLVDAVLLRPLPVRAPAELVLLSERVGPRQVLSWSQNQFRMFGQSQALIGVCAFRPQTDFNVTRTDATEIATGQLVSGNCFELLGLDAEVGRLLSEADDRDGDVQPVAVISDQFWRRYFAADPTVVGRTLELKGHTVTVVGVTPPAFHGFEAGRTVDITVPLSLRSWILSGPMLSSPIARWLRLIGRRRPGVSKEQAAADLDRLWRTLAGTPRPVATPPRFELLDGAQGLNSLRDQFSLPLRLLMGAVGLLLLIACANLASVTLARALARAHEVSLRFALGASRGRIVRQLFTESLVLSAIGGLVGLAAAYWASHAIVALLSRGRSPILLDLTIDPRLLAFTLGISVLTSLAFGAWPSVVATRAGLQPLLQAARTVVAAARSQALIAAQAVLSIVLVIASVLFLRSLAKAQGLDTRVARHQVLLVGIRPGISKEEGPRVAQIFQDLTARLAGAPGVVSLTQAMDIPFGGSSYRANISVPGQSIPDDEQVSFNFVGPNFFQTMGIPLIAGRDLQPVDDSRSRAVAVISQSLADRYFRGRTAVGAHLGGDQAPIEIVGVAADIPYEGVRTEKELVLYRPTQQAGEAGAAGTLAVRADLPPADLADLVRRSLHDSAPGVPIVTMTTLEAQFDGSIVTERLLANIAGFFGSMALLLVAIGVYGTVSASVAQRSRELGVRLALGASKGDLVRMILTAVLLPVSVGLVIGLAAAVLGGRFTQSVLFGVTPRDPATYAMSVVALLLVATIAAVVPARSAARADPLSALRQE